MSVVPVLAKKISRNFRLFIHDTLFSLGWRNKAGILSSPGKRILVYHGLDQKGNRSINSRYLSVSRFENQIRFLKDHAQIISLDNYFKTPSGADKFSVAITFDDGYQNNLLYALPILEKYSVEATFFLTSAAKRGAQWLWMDFINIATLYAPSKIEIEGRLFVKKKWRHTLYFEDPSGLKLVDFARYSPWKIIKAIEIAFINAGAWTASDSKSEYWKLMSPPEIQQLASSRFAFIGAHGHTHQDLAVLGFQDACQELKDCKSFLEKICSRPVTSLAYPFGSYTPELINYAESIGFTQQLAMDYLYPENHCDLRLRERMCINPFISEGNQWMAIKKGEY